MGCAERAAASIQGDTDAVNQVFEARVAAQVGDGRVDLEEKHHLGLILRRLLQPIERETGIAQGIVDDGDIERRDILLRTHLNHLCQDLDGFGSVPGLGIGGRQAREVDGGLRGQRSALLECGDRFGESPLGEVRIIRRPCRAPRSRDGP